MPGVESGDITLEPMANTQGAANLNDKGRPEAALVDMVTRQ